MKKVFLDNLPRGGKFIKDNDINWKNSIGYKVKFIYDDIEGNIDIIEYFGKRKLKVKYNNEFYDIGCSELRTCKIGSIIGKVTNKFRYVVGEIITTKTGVIKITDCIRKKNNKKFYKYHCLKCNYSGEIVEYDLKGGGGCSCCWGKTVIKGTNDVATTYPYLVKYFVNIEDAYTHTYSSPKPVKFKCLTCGNIKTMSLNTFSKNGIMCNRCSDGRSYGEKLFFDIFIQLNVKFETEYSPNWVGKRRYDFYFKHNNEDYICEVNGRQHYVGGFERVGGRNLQEEQKNDRSKKQLALDNGIKPENYIVIDCRKSELEWIKNNENGILNSRLNELFDLSKINWLKAEISTSSSRMKNACDLKRNNPEMTTTDISKIVGVNYGVIREYLVRGTKLKWCYYNPKEEVVQINRRLRSRSKPIICIETGQTFESSAECERQSENVFGVKIRKLSITRVCRGERNHTKGYSFKFI
jgi:hypothetical protein